MMKNGQTRVVFYKNKENSVWGTVCIDWAKRNEKLGASSSIIEITPIDFAAAIQEYGVPYYMKIDIEGCDMVCLNVLRRFQERPDYISFESDKISFANIRYEFDLLGCLGYDSFQAIEQRAIPVSQSPPFPAKEGEYVVQRFEFGCSGLFGAELDDKWKSKHEMLRLYRFIRMGYYLLGDDGIMKKWDFRGAGRLRSLARRSVKLLTQAEFPTWYDTHARHSCADVRRNSLYGSGG